MQESGPQGTATQRRGGGAPTHGLNNDSDVLGGNAKMATMIADICDICDVMSLRIESLDLSQ